MLAEQQTEWMINNILANKGWRISGDDKDKNVYYQKPPYPEQQKKLKGKRPDYILYQTHTNTPIAIIEAKKGGIDLRPAIEQAKEYAVLLNAPLVFAMNGSYCETRFVPNDKELILNKEEVRELLRETEALEFLKQGTNEVCTIPKEVLVSRNDLIAIFADLNDVLRSEGLRAGIERFSEFANILFLKLMSENNERSWWESIKSQNYDDLIGYINGYVISEIQSKYGGDVFTPISIKNPRTLRHIIDTIDPLILSTIDSDIKGDAFEYFIEKTTSTQNDLGEYFTPRHILKTMINLVEPKFKEKIYDPFCGTGGSLTEAFNYIKTNTILEDDKDEILLKEHTLYGGELTTTARIAKMNMVLHGDGHSGVSQTDSLANPVDGQYDVIVTNMPFSQKIARKIRGENGKTKTENLISPLYYNGIAKNNGDAACVLHCLRALKEGGRMALVVPEGFLFRKDTAKVREFLFRKARLQTVISLPQGAFLPYTGVKTDILYFKDAHKYNSQKSYWFFDVKNTGFTLDNHKRKIKGMNDLNKIETSDIRRIDDGNTHLQDNLLEVGFEIVDLEKVKANDWNLTGSVYREARRNKGQYEWVRLEDICERFEYGYTSKSEKTGDTRYVRITDIQEDGNLGENKVFINLSEESSRYLLHKNDIVIARVGSIGKSLLFDEEERSIFASYLIRLHFNKDIISPKYLRYCFDSEHYWDQVKQLTRGAVQPQFNVPSIKNIQIPLPPLHIQQEIVEQLELERAMIESQKEIIKTFEHKMKSRIDALFEPKDATKGRPVENIIDPIDDTPEAVAKAIMKAPPKKKWDYFG